VDVNGVGYEIDVTMSTFCNLPANGEKIRLLPQQAIREDAHLLYGFGSEVERAAFRELLKVSGIGAKTALSVLSGLSVNDLSAAIAAQEIGRIVKVPGIGKKTAERLLLELKGKPVFAGAIASPETPGVSDDVRQALLALGYNERRPPRPCANCRPTCQWARRSDRRCGPYPRPDFLHDAARSTTSAVGIAATPAGMAAAERGGHVWRGDRPQSVVQPGIQPGRPAALHPA